MLKRSYSDSEGEDGFSDGNMDKHPESECHMMNRKKRRGIIEKRRRDRINNSLAELRRLVPTAFEKQGSAKLEKAEILQMTVDHLKMLHAKGLDALTYDPHKVAMDYHSLGFRECAAEVARYLVTVEGMDIQDPLRLRLMSHLQCFSAQRDLAAKQASSWGFPSAPNSTYAAPPPTQPTHVGLPSHIMGAGNQVMSNLDNPGSHTMSAFTPSQSGLGMSMLNDPSSSSSCPNSSMGRLVYSTATTGMTGISPSTQTATNSGQYHVNFNTHSFTGMSPAMGTQSSGYNSPGSQVKPYRPWGAELAY